MESLLFEIQLAKYIDELSSCESQLEKLLIEREKSVEKWHLSKSTHRQIFSAHVAQLTQLAELRKTFDFMKKLPICGSCKDHLNFEMSVVKYLSEVCPKTKTDNICKWIESEYAKLAPKGVLHNFAFIRSLFAAIIHCSINSAAIHQDLIDLNETAFRRWAPILHHFTSDHNVAASQILLFVVQDYAAPLKFSKWVLYNILKVLFENDKFSSCIDNNGVDYNGEYWVSIILNCLLFNAE